MKHRNVIAEIGSCGGDLALAVDTAQAAVEAGAWMVKGQMFRADTLVTRSAPTYGHATIAEPERQYDAFEKALTYDQWNEVAAAAGGRFFASVFDLEACSDYPYPWIKIASADITYRQLIETAATTGAKLILSTGASNQSEIHRALSWINGIHPTLLACTLSYPTDPQDAHVRKMITLRDFRLPVGYSDHTRGVQAANLAFDLDAAMVEKHFTIRPGMGGDDDFAITSNELKAIVDETDPVSEAVAAVYGGSPIVGARAAELPARRLARRSLHAKVDIPAGTMITPAMVAVVRPTGGMDPWLLDDPAGPVGAATRRAVAAGEAILETDLIR